MILENYYHELSNPRYRSLYIIFGMIGLVVLAYEIIANLPDINPDMVLLISLPDMVIFFLAYRTYPPDDLRK